jgi:hypothetical protein
MRRPSQAMAGRAPSIKIFKAPCRRQGAFLFHDKRHMKERGILVYDWSGSALTASHFRPQQEFRELHNYGSAARSTKQNLNGKTISRKVNE